MIGQRLNKLEKLEQATLNAVGYDRIAQARWLLRGLVEKHNHNAEMASQVVAEKMNVPKHFLTVKASDELKKADERLVAIHALRSDIEILPEVIQSIKQNHNISIDELFTFSKKEFPNIDEQIIKKTIYDIYQVIS